MEGLICDYVPGCDSLKSQFSRLMTKIPNLQNLSPWHVPIAKVQGLMNEVADSGRTLFFRQCSRLRIRASENILCDIFQPPIIITRVLMSHPLVSPILFWGAFGCATVFLARKTRQWFSYQTASWFLAGGSLAYLLGVLVVSLPDTPPIIPSVPASAEEAWDLEDEHDEVDNLALFADMHVFNDHIPDSGSDSEGEVDYPDIPVQQTFEEMVANDPDYDFEYPEPPPGWFSFVDSSDDEHEPFLMDPSTFDQIPFKLDGSTAVPYSHYVIALYMEAEDEDEAYLYARTHLPRGDFVFYKSTRPHLVAKWGDSI